MKSYINDYRGSYVCGKESARMTYKAGFVACGITMILMGILLSTVTVLAGAPMAIAGAAVATLSILYYRPKKKK